MDHNNSKEAKEDVANNNTKETKQDAANKKQDNNTCALKDEHIHVLMPHTDKYMGASFSFVQPYEIIHREHPKRDICVCSLVDYDVTTKTYKWLEPTYRISSPLEAVMFSTATTEQEICKRLHMEDIEKFRLRPNVLFLLPSRNIENPEKEILQLYYIEEVRRCDTHITLEARRMEEDREHEGQWTAKTNNIQNDIREVNLSDRQIINRIHFLRRKDRSLITMNDKDNVDMHNERFWRKSDALKCITKFTKQYERKRPQPMDTSDSQPMDMSPDSTDESS